LFNASADGSLSTGAFGYFRARNRNRVYEAVVNEFVASGLSQAELARRMGKRPDVVCRLIGAPGNWTLDTVSDLLLAISNGEMSYQVSYPLEQSRRNANEPEWLSAASNILESYQSTAGRQNSMASRGALFQDHSNQVDGAKGALLGAE